MPMLTSRASDPSPSAKLPPAAGTGACASGGQSLPAMSYWLDATEVSAVELSSAGSTDDHHKTPRGRSCFATRSSFHQLTRALPPWLPSGR